MKKPDETVRIHLEPIEMPTPDLVAALLSALTVTAVMEIVQRAVRKERDELPVIV